MIGMLVIISRCVMIVIATILIVIITAGIVIMVMFNIFTNSMNYS